MSSTPSRRLRLGLAAGLVWTTVGVTAVGAAAADPAEGPSPDPVVELHELSRQAEALGQELHTARAEADTAAEAADDAARRAGVARGRAALAASDAVRGQDTVDSVATLRYRGGGADAARAALLAQSPQDLVDRLGLLQVLSGQTTQDLDVSQRRLDEAGRLRAAADAAATDARTAADRARERERDLDVRNQDLGRRVDEVRARVDALDAEARARWTGGTDLTPVGYDAATVGDGPNKAALQAGLTKLGSPYEWGATGPEQFDCSGLMVWSYRQIGKSLPRSSQMQAAGGTPVARGDAQPGDLVLYYQGATHVGMYAGDGQVLHAPDYGIPVKLAPVDSMPIVAIRRY